MKTTAPATKPSPHGISSPEAASCTDSLGMALDVAVGELAAGEAEALEGDAVGVVELVVVLLDGVVAPSSAEQAPSSSAAPLPAPRRNRCRREMLMPPA